MAYTEGGDFYSWSPSLIKYKDPRTGFYFGNVVGSTPLEVRIAEIATVAQNQKDNIEQTGTAWYEAINALAYKYAEIWKIVNWVTENIIKSSGDVFILDQSVLDSETDVLY